MEQKSSLKKDMELTFEDWIKLELKVAEVKSIKDKIILTIDNKDFSFNKKLKVKVGDKILIGICNKGFVIPVVDNGISIVPEKDIKVGSRVG